MHEVRERGPLGGPHQPEQTEQALPGGRAAGRPLRRLVRGRAPRSRIRAGRRRRIRARRPAERVHRADQLGLPERLGEERDPGGQRQGVPSGDHQAPGSRGGVVGQQRVDQVCPPLAADPGIDEDRVVPAGAHRACLRHRGGEIDVISRTRQRPAHEGADHLVIVHDQHPLTIRLCCHGPPSRRLGYQSDPRSPLITQSSVYFTISNSTGERQGWLPRGRGHGQRPERDT